MTSSPRTLSDDAVERLQDLPPSAKLVAKTLEYEGELTQGELADHTRLPPRTVRHAVSDLEEANLIDATVSFADARKRQYVLDSDLIEEQYDCCGGEPSPETTTS